MEKSKIIEKLFFNIVTYSYLLIPIGFLVFSFRKYRKAPVPLTLALYGVIFFVLLFFYYDIPTEYSKYYQSFYTFLEYAVFAFLFYWNIQSKKFRNFLIFASILFLVFQIIYLLTIKVRRLDSIPVGIETILLLTYIIYFFFDFSKHSTTSYIYNHYCFWLSLGILFYLGGSFFFYILIDHLDKDEINTFGNLTYMAEIGKNILFTTSIFFYARSPYTKQIKNREPIPFLDHI